MLHVESSALLFYGPLLFLCIKRFENEIKKQNQQTNQPNTQQTKHLT